MTVPDWVQDAVFYQIFPDRFANGDRTNDPPRVRRWLSTPKVWGFHGGDFQGVIQKFDYLLDLGVNALYFTPIFKATSNHRYNASDYFVIDPRLGDLKTFQAFLNLAHRHGVHVILDGVFNHCGRGFFAFHDILENQRHSPYVSWFHIKRFPVNAYSPGKASDYLAWWGIKSLPKFNTDNPEVRRYLLNVAAYWIEQGIDGWRLDVPNEIDDDSFWAEFRSVVKSINPQAYLLGEIWVPDLRWVGDSHFDGLMNYPVRTAVLDLMENGNSAVSNFVERLTQLIDFYPVENLSSMYVLLGSHDTERLLTRLAGSVQKARLAYLIQFSLPGAPAIYYGDEIGLTGGKDPGCRAAFPWNEQLWNHELRSWIKTLVSIRKRNEPLRRGKLSFIPLDDQPGILAFSRRSEPEKTLVIVNPGNRACQFELPAERLTEDRVSPLRSLLTGKEYPLRNGKFNLDLEPWSGDWLQ